MNIGDTFKAKHFNNMLEFTIKSFWDDGFGHLYVDVIRQDGVKSSWLKSDLEKNIV